MDTLLMELGRLVVPRTRRRVAVGATGASLLMIGIALGWPRYIQYANELRSCSEHSAQATEVWGEDQQKEVRNAIVSTDLPYAVDTWMRVSQRLDEYTNDWSRGYGDACVAHARQEQDDHDWGLRRECFRDRKVALDATVEVLGQADARVAERAVGLVQKLPSLKECHDIDRLNSRRSQLIPQDLQSMMAVEELRKELTTVKVEQDAGRYPRALELVEPLGGRVEELEYAPLKSELLFRRGSVRADNGLYAESERDLMEAYSLAMEYSYDDIVFLSANSLAMGLSLRQSRHQEAGVWAAVALPIARRERDAPRLAWTFRALALVSYGKGDYAGAEAHHRQALRLLDGATDIPPTSLAYVLNDLGHGLSMQGKHEEAEQHHRHALRLREDALGRTHPDVAMSLNNLGYAVEGQGRYEEAERYYRRSLSIREDALGSNDQYVSNSAESLASVLVRRKRYEEAEVCYRRVLKIRELASNGNEGYLQAAFHNLGVVLLVQGRYDDAENNFRRSLRILERLSDERNPEMIDRLVGLAEVALAREDFEGARAHASAAITIGESNSVTPDRLAGARFVLARALWPEDVERRRSFVLAKWALDAYVYKGPGQDENVAEVDEWISTHHNPRIYG